jgi:hypothetical protein
MHNGAWLLPAGRGWRLGDSELGAWEQLGRGIWGWAVGDDSSGSGRGCCLDLFFFSIDVSRVGRPPSTPGTAPVSDGRTSGLVRDRTKVHPDRRKRKVEGENVLPSRPQVVLLDYY